MTSGLSEEQIKAIVTDRFKPVQCEKCGKSTWEVGVILMPDRTMKMLNLRIIRCTECGHVSEWQ